jgi:hypothetical protein
MAVVFCVCSCRRADGQFAGDWLAPVPFPPLERRDPAPISVTAAASQALCQVPRLSCVVVNCEASVARRCHLAVGGEACRLLHVEPSEHWISGRWQHEENRRVWHSGHARTQPWPPRGQGTTRRARCASRPPHQLLGSETRAAVPVSSRQAACALAAGHVTVMAQGCHGRLAAQGSVCVGQSQGSNRRACSHGDAARDGRLPQVERWFSCTVLQARVGARKAEERNKCSRTVETIPTDHENRGSGQASPELRQRLGRLAGASSTGHGRPGSRAGEPRATMIKLTAARRPARRCATRIRKILDGSVLPAQVIAPVRSARCLASWGHEGGREETGTGRTSLGTTGT